MSGQKQNSSGRRSRKGTVILLVSIAVAAAAIVILFMPVLQIFGDEMSPVVTDGDLVLSVKSKEIKDGDIVAFYHNNKILIKRVIATQGETVNIDEDGTVYVNGEKREEPYVTELAKGNCSIDLPCQVPEAAVFVMGDHRSESVDSRDEALGCVSEEQIVGKLLFCFWPPADIGMIK